MENAKLYNVAWNAEKRNFSQIKRDLLTITENMKDEDLLGD